MYEKYVDRILLIFVTSILIYSLIKSKIVLSIFIGTSILIVLYLAVKYFIFVKKECVK
jgi:hypothetical protein